MRRRLQHLCLLLALPVFLPAGDAVSLESPFLPEKGAPTAVAPVDNSDYEYVGALSAGNDTMIGILNKNTQKSFWVGVGKTAEGVEIVSRSRETGDIVARFGGTLHTLKLRAPNFSKTQVVAYTPPAPPQVATRPAVGQPNPAAPKPAKPTPALTQQQMANADQEREARMLVSDLLEIGAQQRKAYEEAQKRKTSPTAPATK